MISTSVLKPIEKLINRGIDQSDEAAALCRVLEGRRMVVRIDIQPVKHPLEISVTACDEQVHIADDAEGKADVEISGILSELTRLMFSEAQQPLREGRVRIQGQAEIAEQFRTLFVLARPDLEEELSALVGDDLGFQLAGALKRIRHYAIDALEDIAEQTSAYLHEDGEHLPERSETDEFFTAVDELSNDLARVEARMARIRKNIDRHVQNGE